MASPPILVVQGDAELRTILCALLVAEGIEVVAADSLADARAHLATSPVSGVLLDHVVEDGSAPELLDELKTVTSPPPVVLVSGDPAAVDIAKRYGVGFARKPFDAHVVIAAVEAMQEGRGRPK